jgi:TRAP transporter T-component
LNRTGCLSLFIVLAVGLAGCSPKRIIVNKIGAALTSGPSSFETDDDPDLVGDAMPFALKTIESLIVQSPENADLLLAATSGFTEYSYVYVAQKAERLAGENLEESNALRARSRRLALRAHAYGTRGLEARYKGLGAQLESDQNTALERVKKRDVPLLYWTAASQGLAISEAKDDPEMIAQLPLVEAMARRAMALDEAWNQGTLPEFMITLEAARQGVKQEDRQKSIDGYYRRALELSGGSRPSLFVSYAENSCIPSQNRAQFKEMLDRAIRIDAGQNPETRLAAVIAQRRAYWLLGRADELFLEGAAPGGKVN